ncbi:MAG: hypothetical protein AAGE03_14645 [Pseudomonadota bacterium]
MIRTAVAALCASAALAGPAPAQDIEALRERFQQRQLSGIVLPSGLRQASLCGIARPDLAAAGPWQATTAFRLADLSNALATMATAHDPASRGDVAFGRPASSGEATHADTPIPDLPVRTIRPVAPDDLDPGFASVTGRPLGDLLADPAFVDIAGCGAQDRPIFIGAPPRADPFGNPIVATEDLGYQVSTTGPGGVQGADRGSVTTLFMR